MDIHKDRHFDTTLAYDPNSAKENSHLLFACASDGAYMLILRQSSLPAPPASPPKESPVVVLRRMLCSKIIITSSATLNTKVWIARRV